MKRPDGPSVAVKMRVLKRDKYTCVYCGVPGTEAELEIDHIVPISKNGSNHISNLATACRKCNQKKGSKEAPARADSNLKKDTGADKNYNIVGLSLHILEYYEPLDYWFIDKQGYVAGEDGDYYLVQHYSWISGNETNIIAYPKHYILSKECRLYKNDEAMIDYGIELANSGEYKDAVKRRHRIEAEKENEPPQIHDQYTEWKLRSQEMAEENRWIFM